MSAALSQRPLPNVQGLWCTRSVRTVGAHRDLLAAAYEWMHRYSDLLQSRSRLRMIGLRMDGSWMFRVATFSGVSVWMQNDVSIVRVASGSEEPQGSSDYSNPTPVIPPDLRTKNRHPVEKLTRLTGCTKPDKLENYARVSVMVGFNWIFLIQSARYAS